MKKINCLSVKSSDYAGRDRLEGGGGGNSFCCFYSDIQKNEIHWPGRSVPPEKRSLDREPMRVLRQVSQ